MRYEFRSSAKPVDDGFKSLVEIYLDDKFQSAWLVGYVFEDEAMSTTP